MIHINLLPVREITQRLKLKRQILLSALVFLCFLGCDGRSAVLVFRIEQSLQYGSSVFFDSHHVPNVVMLFVSGDKDTVFLQKSKVFSHFISMNIEKF